MWVFGGIERDSEMCFFKCVGDRTQLRTPSIFKHGHVAYQIDRDDKQNKMHVIFHPMVKLVTFG